MPVAPAFVVLQSCVPVRAEPSHRAEQVTQLLFGETFTLAEEAGDWLAIRCTYDEYPGWVPRNQVDLAAQAPATPPRWFTAPVQLVTLTTPGSEAPHEVWAWLGSCFPGTVHEELAFFELGERQVLTSAAHLVSSLPVPEAFRAVGHLVGAPYLWGGRSVPGIDCSGLTQLFARLCGVRLRRDAGEQVTQGDEIAFDARKPGDLVFFNNAEGKITHVGLVNENIGTVLHASGSVRVDYLHENGIRHRENNSITHHLHSTRRILG